MDRLRRLFSRKDDSYEPLPGGTVANESDEAPHPPPKRFSWVNYSVYFLLGVAMLWAWNMFLAAGPYFQKRFASNESILSNFQSAELSVSTVANLGSMLILTKLQEGASYPRRIMAALALNTVIFTVLALSTRMFTNVSAGVYFGFLMVMVFAASLATGLCQNGVFAYVAGSGLEEYTQAIMTGQAVAGVLPCIAQIVSVLSVPPRKAGAADAPQESSTSAFSYFLTATGISAVTLLAFLVLLSRQGDRPPALPAPEDLTASQASLFSASGRRKPVPLTRLFRKLSWLSAAVFLTFGVTMFFPVFTQKIESVRPAAPDRARLFDRASFVPLAFLFWNTGDLAGRLLLAVPGIPNPAATRPRLVFALAAARAGFIPLYLLCNLGGRGAAVPSDAFYLGVVQVLFGLTNGFVGSACMMGFVEWVGEGEREAAGGFMSLSLVGGLAAGSFLSFVAAGSGK